MFAPLTRAGDEVVALVELLPAASAKRMPVAAAFRTALSSAVLMPPLWSGVQN